MIKGTLFLAAVFSFLGQPTQACRFTDVLKPSALSQAETVFVGRIVGLASASVVGWRSSEKVTTVTLDIERVIRGRQVSGTINVYGYDSTSSQFPRSKEALVKKLGAVVEVGVVFPETIKARTSCRYSDYVNGGGEPQTSVHCGIDLPVLIPFDTNATIPLKYPTIIGDTCTDPYIHTVGKGLAWPGPEFDPQWSARP